MFTFKYHFDSSGLFQMPVENLFFVHFIKKTIYFTHVVKHTLRSITLCVFILSILNIFSFFNTIMEIGIVLCVYLIHQLIKERINRLIDYPSSRWLQP